MIRFFFFLPSCVSHLERFHVFEITCSNWHQINSFSCLPSQTSHRHRSWQTQLIVTISARIKGKHPITPGLSPLNTSFRLPPTTERDFLLADTNDRKQIRSLRGSPRPKCGSYSQPSDFSGGALSCPVILDRLVANR